MPNWCKNFLRVTGPAEAVARFQKQAAAAELGPEAKPALPPEAFSFQRLVPLPATRSTPTGTKSDFGSPGQEWGCNGDASQSHLAESWDGEALYQFATPWNPPLAFLRRVSALWPTLDFILDYDEPMLAFRGTARAHAGKLQHFYLDL